MRKAKQPTTKFSQLRRRNEQYKLRFTNVPEQFVGPHGFRRIITAGQSGTCRTSLMLAILVNQVRNKRLNNVGDRGMVYVSDFEGYCNMTLFELINCRGPKDFIVHKEISQAVGRAGEDLLDVREVRREVTAQKEQQCRLFVKEWFRKKGYELVVGGFTELKSRIAADVLRGRVVIHCAEEIDHKFAELSQSLLGYTNYQYIATRHVDRYAGANATIYKSQRTYFLSDLVLQCERIRDEVAQTVSFNTKSIRNKAWYTGTERDTMTLITELIN